MELDEGEEEDEDVAAPTEKGNQTNSLIKRIYNKREKENTSPLKFSCTLQNHFLYKSSQFPQYHNAKKGKPRVSQVARQCQTTGQVMKKDRPGNAPTWIDPIKPDVICPFKFQSCGTYITCSFKSNNLYT